MELRSAFTFTMLLSPSELLLSVAMAISAGLVGCFAVMRRMTLAADALSHVALPGIGIALALRAHPAWGAGAMLLVGAILIWVLEERTRISTETLTGVVFSAALAVGSMMTSGEELIEALFGAPGTLTHWELALGLSSAAVIVFFTLGMRRRLVLALVSSEIAHTAGIRVARLNLLYLVTFALTVALGLRYLGVLLMGSLIIIPAATARRLAGNLNRMFTISVTVAVASTVGGSYLAVALEQQTGPVIVTLAAGCFLLSLFHRSGR